MVIGMSGEENKLIQLQKKIEQTKQELEQIKQLEKPNPELINTTNVIRSNEYLLKEIQTHAKLLSAYEDYSAELEKIVHSTSIIKSKIKQLKTCIKSRKKPKTKRRKKSSRKVRRKTKKPRRKIRKARRKTRKVKRKVKRKTQKRRR